MEYCNRPAEVIFVQHVTKGEMHVTTKDLRDLLSHNKSIADETITLYLELLTVQCNLAFLATNTIPKLRREGWATVQRSFASFRNRRRTNTRPALTGEPVLIIPCFVDGCHWVTVVRREMRGQVKFFLADDLNSPSTAQDIKQLLSAKNTSNVFSPPGSQWIVCKNYTYTPHSNECGPRSLVAATILALHPNPTNYALLSCMHPNLAQISRTWVAMSLLTNNINQDAILSLFTPSQGSFPRTTRVESNPSYLIPWSTHHQVRPTSQTTKNSIKEMCSLKEEETTSMSSRSHPTKSVKRKVNIPQKRNAMNDIPTRQSTKLAQPARHQVQLQPGQSLLTKYFTTKKVIPALDPVPAPSIMKVTNSSQMPTTQTASTHEGHNQPNSKKNFQPILQTKLVKKPTLQRTMYDFHYFKPHASVSNTEPDTWGHIPESIDTMSTFRLILTNPNGIRPSVTNPDFMFSLHLCHEIGAGAICLAETNLNWHHSQHHAALHRCLQKNWPASKYQISVPDEIFLGGLGRWSFVMLGGKQDINICIISAYHVCDDKYTGPKTAYQQQKRQLSAMFRKQK